MKTPCTALAIAAILASAAARGIDGQQAPRWDIDEWIHLSEGQEKLGIDDFKGKVLYLFTFQSW